MLIVSLDRVQAQSERLQVSFYNVENLFDTIDSRDTYDEDFTPNGKNAYDTKRYEKKLENLAKVINEGHANSRLDVLGLCEVENLEVVAALKKRLTDAEQLVIVHYDSPDGRGIDNAFIYNKNVFELLDAGMEDVHLGADMRPTRGIVWGLLEERKSKAQLLVFVNHWPSRYGGAEASSWKRETASRALKGLIIEKQSMFPEACIVAMGDFNDYPSNRSIQVLTECEDESVPCLVNMHEHLSTEGRGTHAYQGEWGVLDQMLVSRNMVTEDCSFTVKKDAGETIAFDWMMYTSSKDHQRLPSRSYGGSTYYGGYSDHLPITLTLWLQP